MLARVKKIILILAVFVSLAALVGWFIYEAQFFNLVSFVWPIDFNGHIPIRADARGSGEFGSHRNGGRKHAGVDIEAKIGEPVKAIRSGVVINAEKKRGLGNYVELRHSGGLVSIYAHLNEMKVRKGQRVRQGQVIGTVGKTGNANYRAIESHLHFEIREKGVPRDPGEYLEE